MVVLQTSTALNLPSPPHHLKLGDLPPTDDGADCLFARRGSEQAQVLLRLVVVVVLGVGHCLPLCGLGFGLGLSATVVCGEVCVGVCTHIPHHKSRGGHSNTVEPLLTDSPKCGQPP